MIPVLGYCALYKILDGIVIGILEDIFCCDMQYDTHQAAVSAIHMITILASVVQLLPADEGRESRKGEVQAIRWSAHHRRQREWD